MKSLVLLKIYILMAIVDKMEGHVLGLAWQIRKLAGKPDPAFQYLQRWMDSCQGICDRVSWIGGETYDEDNEVLSYRYFIFFEDKQVGLSELAKKLQRMMDETGMVYGDACDELWPPLVQTSLLTHTDTWPSFFKRWAPPVYPRAADRYVIRRCREVESVMESHFPQYKGQFKRDPHAVDLDPCSWRGQHDVDHRLVFLRDVSSLTFAHVSSFCMVCRQQSKW